MDGLGPLELMYSWQALLCASACVGVTKIPTTAIDIAMGKEKRKANKWLTHFVFPMIPVLVGILYVCLVPLRPEPLTEFVDEHVHGFGWQLVAYGAYGAACGQFSQTIYDKFIQPFFDMRKPKASA